MSCLTQNPVGVLDSGFGGLSVLSSLRRELPLEDFVYCADSGNAPWGEKTPAFIVDRCRAIARFLIEKHGIKCLVLACNTATAFAADVLRQELTLPIIGIEPAVKPAAAQSHSRVVGVIATRGTVESPRYHSLLTRFAGDCQVISVGASGLMECVEKGDFEGPETMRLLEKYLKPMQQAGIDKLVLGCTHYPFLSRAIGRMLGPSVELIEPGKAVAAVTRTRLTAIDALREENAAPYERFFVKGLEAHAEVLACLWPQVLQSSIKPEELRV